MDDLKQKITDIIVEQLGVDESEVQPEASLTEDLGADSLDHIEIVMAIEEYFGIDIPEPDAVTLKTVAEIHTYLGGRLAASAQKV